MIYRKNIVAILKSTITISHNDHGYRRPFRIDKLINYISPVLPAVTDAFCYFLKGETMSDGPMVPWMGPQKNLKLGDNFGLAI